IPLTVGFCHSGIFFLYPLIQHSIFSRHFEFSATNSGKMINPSFLVADKTEACREPAAVYCHFLDWITQNVYGKFLASFLFSSICYW
ncbi:hypothetical protein, partial [Klebsiella pneumoniae]